MKKNLYSSHSFGQEIISRDIQKKNGNSDINEAEMDKEKLRKGYSYGKEAVIFKSEDTSHLEED